MCIA
jgi:cullin-associated NEDD8-dissociated protein 1